MNKHQKYLIEVYLEWTNDYLSMEKMAYDYGIRINVMSALIQEGRRLHDWQQKENELGN